MVFKGLKLFSDEQILALTLQAYVYQITAGHNVLLLDLPNLIFLSR
jgi:hypothetical protein